MDKHTSQLICRYLDGDLAPQEREEVQALLESNPQAAALFEDLREQQAALQALPTHALARDLADDVVERIQSLGVERQAGVATTDKLTSSASTHKTAASAAANAMPTANAPAVSSDESASGEIAPSTTISPRTPARQIQSRRSSSWLNVAAAASVLLAAVTYMLGEPYESRTAGLALGEVVTTGRPVEDGKTQRLFTEGKSRRGQPGLGLSRLDSRKEAESAEESPMQLGTRLRIQSQLQRIADNDVDGLEAGQAAGADVLEMNSLDSARRTGRGGENADQETTSLADSQNSDETDFAAAGETNRSFRYAAGDESTGDDKLATADVGNLDLEGLMIVHVDVTETAWRTQAFRTLLEQNQIRFEDPAAEPQSTGKDLQQVILEEELAFQSRDTFGGNDQSRLAGGTQRDANDNAAELRDQAGRFVQPPENELADGLITDDFARITEDTMGGAGSQTVEDARVELVYVEADDRQLQDILLTLHADALRLANFRGVSWAPPQYEILATNKQAAGYLQGQGNSPERFYQQLAENIKLRLGELAQQETELAYRGLGAEAFYDQSAVDRDGELANTSGGGSGGNLGDAGPGAGGGGGPPIDGSLGRAELSTRQDDDGTQQGQQAAGQQGNLARNQADQNQQSSGPGGNQQSSEDVIKADDGQSTHGQSKDREISREELERIASMNSADRAANYFRIPLKQLSKALEQSTAEQQGLANDTADAERGRQTERDAVAGGNLANNTATDNNTGDGSVLDQDNVARRGRGRGGRGGYGGGGGQAGRGGRARGEQQQQATANGPQAGLSVIEAEAKQAEAVPPSTPRRRVLFILRRVVETPLVAPDGG